MKALFWTLALFALAVGLTLAGKNSHSYIVVVYPPYRIQLALNLLIALWAATLALGYGLVRVVVHTLRLPASVRRFRADQQRRQGRKALLDGLIAYFEGRFARAEKLAAKALALREFPAVSAPLAARAAHEIKAFNRRDDYLAQAERLAPGYPLPRLMTQAELLVGTRDYAGALAALHHVYEIAPKHPAALKLELPVQSQAKNWEQVLQLTTALEKRDAIEPAQARQLRIKAHTEIMTRKASDNQMFDECWARIPAAEQVIAPIALAAARHFMALGRCEQAHGVIERSLAREWNVALIKAYPECRGGDLLRRIEQAERWLAAHADDAALLLTLGRLCTQQALWGKAQSYLEASLAVEPTAEAHVALAQLLENRSQLTDACVHYRRSLELALAGD